MEFGNYLVASCGWTGKVCSSVSFLLGVVLPIPNGGHAHTIRFLQQPITVCYTYTGRFPSLG